MLAANRSIKADGPQPAARQALESASNALLLRGAEVQMIACTEFSLIAESAARGVVTFDTLDILVDLIKAFALDL